jgi:hypothetical protein
MKIATIHLLKAIVAQSGIIMIILYAVQDRFRIKATRSYLSVTLVGLAIVSAWAMYDCGHYAKWPFYINKHDFWHYYMGPKYSQEVGYVHLYPCAAIVDAENDARFERTGVRDQEDYSKTISVKDILRRRDEYKAKFTPERWEEFEHDVLFFRQLMGKGRWQKALGDKGYNATPVWNMPARIMTNMIPTPEPLQGEDLRYERIGFGLRCLLGLDLALIVLLMTAISWAFGWRTMLFAMVFFGTNYMINQTHIKGSILRMDWMSFLVISTCLLKKGYYKTSGALMGYAAMSRIFPAVFLFGMGAKLLWPFVSPVYDRLGRRFSSKRRTTSKPSNTTSQERQNLWTFLITTLKSQRRYLEFFVVLSVVVAIAFSLSVQFDGGIKKWKKYQELINHHNEDIVGVRTGFKHVFLNLYNPSRQAEYRPVNRGDTWKKNVQKKFEEQHLVWNGILLLVLGVSFFAVRGLEDHETVPYGFVLAFFMATPTFYYYVMLVVPLLLFAPKLDRIPQALGMAFMFAVSVLGYVLYIEMKQNFTMFYVLSWMYLILSLYIMYIAFQTRPAPTKVTEQESN